MDTPEYGETLKFMYTKYQPILVVLPKVRICRGDWIPLQTLQRFTKLNYGATRTIYESQPFRAGA